MNRPMQTDAGIAKAALPPAALVIAVTIFVVAGLGPNTLLAALAIGVLLVGTSLLWRPGEPPILLLVFAYQWLQSSVGVFYANWLGVNQSRLNQYGSGDVDLATALSLVGLTFLALGARLGAGPWQQSDGATARMTASRFSIAYWFQLYLVAFFVATVAQSCAYVIPSLSQPMLSIASLKWAFFWILAFASFSRSPHSYGYWLAAFGLEMALGIGGYFADFRMPLFFTLLAAAAAKVRLSVAQYLALGTLVAVALTMGLAWSAVKKDYRRYVSGGAGQMVTIGYSDRMAKLAEMVGNLNGRDMSEASETMLKRLSYVEFFGVVLDRVPAVLPHENGNIWIDAISRPFMPRILFPSKTSIDDSERTIRYTGLYLATAKEGTSISIGYMGESYIDFGTVGMMVPIFGFGLLLGSLYRWLLRMDEYRLLGAALATATIFNAAYLESSITKTFGGVIVAVLASWLVMRTAPKYFPWVRLR